MKGGKDEEKIMGPMFPRLHVNDTEKGGPRAPPRNKMALYEQLSIPSQRFNSGSQLLTNNSSLAPTASLNQGSGRERTVFSPFRIPPPASAHSADNLHSHSTEGLNSKTRTQTSEQQKSMKVANYQMSNSLMHLPPAPESASFNPNDPVNSKNLYTSKLGDDDDFKVPTFASSRNPKKDQTVDREKFTPHSPTRLGQTTSTPVDNMPKIVASTCSSSTHHNTRDKHLKRTNTTDLRSRQHSWDHSEENQLDSVTSKDCAGNATSCPLIREMVAEPSFHAYETPIQEYDNPMDNLGEHDNNMRLHHKYRMEFLQNTTPSDAILPEPVGLTEKGNVILVRNETCSRASIRNDHASPNEPCEDEANEVLQVEDVDRNDDVSETSMVDSITVLDISPDDVVGVIGQKHFWKARRAIVNQQRLFAVQVFELHRLIKVQKLIAGSPHLLLDDTYLSQPAIKVAPIKNLSEYGLNSSQQIVKQKNESQKQSQSTECAAENVVRKPLPSPSDGVNNALGNHHSSYGPYAGNHPAPPAPPAPAPAPVAPDNKAGWYFHPPPGNQWLIPVMSPSEGLVYKPYAGPCPPSAGFMAPMYGGCGPMNMTPLEGGFPGSPYGIPPAHPQGIGALPGAPQTYFSPYGMPIMNPLMSSSAVEQANQHQLHPLAGAQPLGYPGQLSTGDANFKMHSRNSCNVSNQRSEAISPFKFQASKGSEIQGSTASSPCEKAQGKGAGYASEGGDALSLFPMSPAIQARDQTPETRSSEQQHTRVIKVVPHNPRSATESAARIFQSIQEERQQHD